MRRALCLWVNPADGKAWIMSMYTGEIVRPWEIRKVFGMIWDFRLRTV